MKHVAHLIWADVRRFRYLIALWLLVEIAVATTIGLQPTFVSSERIFSVASIVASLVNITEMLLMLVVVPLVVQADQVVGTTAFWLTRPIAPGILLTAKAFTLWLVLVALPDSLQVVLMVAHQVPAGDIVRVTLQSILLLTLWLLFLMMLASLTSSIARYAALGGALVLGFAVFLAVTTMIAFSSPPDPSRRPPSGGGGTTEAVLLLLFLWIAAGVFLGVQYSRRSWWRAVAAGVASAIVGVWSASHASLRFLDRPSEPPSSAVHDPVRLIGGSGSAVASPEFLVGRSSRRRVQGSVLVTGAPADWSASITLDSASATLPDGRRIDSGFGYSGPVMLVGLQGDEVRVDARLLGVDRLGQQNSAYPGTVLLSLHDRDLEQIRSAPARYEGRFDVELEHHTIDAVLPLTRGATHQHGAFRLVVERLAERFGTVGLLVRVSTVKTMFDPGPASTVGYYLRNPGLREAVGGSPTMLHESLVSRVLPISFSDETFGFSTRAYFVSFMQPGMEPKSQIKLTDAWLAGAELVVVRVTKYSPVIRTLAIDKLSITQEEEVRSVTRE